MRQKRYLILIVFLGVLAIALFLSCSNTTDYKGESPEIDRAHYVIIFRVADGVSDVTFTHKAHAEYWDNNCLVCHMHTDVRDSTIWSCSSCHSNDDSQGLCVDDKEGHDCMYVQCLGCHETLTPDPAPDCSDCHIPIYSGVFIDSPVGGLSYETTTQMGLTNTGGIFDYLAGESITFALGSTDLGSAVARAVMTPIDLINGAVDETDPTVTNISRLLQTLDMNGNLSDGILIPSAVKSEIQNWNISFDMDTVDFENNADVLGFIDALNQVGVFTDGSHTLISASEAQTNLRNAIDSVFPPPTGTRILGPPNTNFVLTGAYDDSGGQYEFQWYRADDAIGTNESAISGATSETYRPVAGEVTKWLTFEVTPVSGGGTSGAPSRSSPVGPVTSISMLTIYDTIGSPSEVDSFTFRLDTAMGAIMNVESFESPNCAKAPCDFFGNGNSNDHLITNIYLFDDSGPPPVDYMDCTPVGCSMSPSKCLPGCLAPGAFVSRSGKNPYMDVSLGAGDYHFRVGAAILNGTDAWSGVNSGGAYYNPTDAYNYRITFTFY